MMLLNINESSEDKLNMLKGALLPLSENDKIRYEKDGNKAYLLQFYTRKYSSEAHCGNTIYVDVYGVESSRLPRCIKSKQKLEDCIDKYGIELYNKYKKDKKLDSCPFNRYRTVHKLIDRVYMIDDICDNKLQAVKLKMSCILYHYNFERQGRKYSVVLLSDNKTIFAAYFISTSGYINIKINDSIYK